MRTDKKNLAIAALSVGLGVSLISLVTLWMGGGPAVPPLPTTTTETAKPATADKPKTPEPPPTPTVQRVNDHPPAPHFEWRQERKESFVLDAGQGNIYGPVQSSCMGDVCRHLIRWDIKATAPVDAGAIDADLVEGGNLGYSFDSLLTLCYTPKTLQSEHECRLTGSTKAGYILMRDSRASGPASAVGALAAGLMGAKEPLQRATLTVYSWTCVQFCN